MADFEQLREQAEVIRDEYRDGRNTATRVGTEFVDIVDAVEENATDIADEVTNRENADTSLQGNIDAEEEARIQADNTLQGNIDAEVLARQGADTDLENRISPNLLTEAQKTWINSQMDTERQEEANALYSVTTSTTGTTTYYTDTTEQASMSAVVNVVLAFNGTSGLGAASIPSGWSEVTDGTGTKYTKSISYGTSAAATAFTYTIPDSDTNYGGLSVTKNSTAKSISSINPAYWGMATTNDVANINSFIGNLTRATSSVSGTQSIPNNTGTTAYFVIVTKGSATATQIGQTILNAPTTGISFTSPQNGAITMSGYKVYFSTNSIAAGATLANVALNISL